MKDFLKCPECGLLDARRSRCECGYELIAKPSTGWESKNEPLAKKAAYWCAGLPLGHIVLACIYNNQAARDREGTVAFLFMAVGGCLLFASIVCGIIAICGIPKHGYKGILVRAVVGLGFSIAVLGYWIWLFTQ